MPPRALMSSSAICMASSAALPLGARPPVSAMPKPMVSGLAWALAVLPAKPVAAPARASLLKVRRSMRMKCPPRHMFVESILARRGAPCHPEGEARGTFRAAGKVPRCARDDNIALAPVRAPRSSSHQRRRTGGAQRMLAENGALDVGRKHRMCVGGMGVAEKSLHGAGRVEAA